MACRNRALRGISKGSIRSPRKKSVKIAVIEPLEVPARAPFGHRGRNQVKIAVIEPLEVSPRAPFGRRGRNQKELL